MVLAIHHIAPALWLPPFLDCCFYCFIRRDSQVLLVMAQTYRAQEVYHNRANMRRHHQIGYCILSRTSAISTTLCSPNKIRGNKCCSCFFVLQLLSRTTTAALLQWLPGGNSMYKSSQVRIILPLECIDGVLICECGVCLPVFKVDRRL